MNSSNPNRLVAGPLGTLVSLVSGLAAAWLISHVPGLHLDPSATTDLISFGIGTAVAELGRQRWLKGWQKFEADHRASIESGLDSLNDYLREHGKFPPGFSEAPVADGGTAAAPAE